MKVTRDIVKATLCKKCKTDHRFYIDLDGLFSLTIWFLALHASHKVTESFVSTLNSYYNVRR